MLGTRVKCLPEDGLEGQGDKPGKRASMLIVSTSQNIGNHLHKGFRIITRPLLKASTVRKTAKTCERWSNCDTKYIYECANAAVAKQLTGDQCHQGFY